MMEIANIPLFQGLTPDEMNLIQRSLTQRNYPKGATVFVEGQETDGVYIILSGLVKVLIMYKDGREKTLTILKPGDFLGEVTVFGSEVRSATVETLEMTTFVVITTPEFRILLEKIPTLAIRVIEILSYRLRQANRQIQELSFLNSRSRVICNLVNLAEMHGKREKDEIGITLRMTHAELAKMAGVSRETVTKVIAELQDLGLLKIIDRRFRILSIDKLYRQVM